MFIPQIAKYGMIYQTYYYTGMSPANKGKAKEVATLSPQVE